MTRENILIVSTTLPDKVKADELADAIVKNKLAACVQLSSITSVYRWEEKIEKSDEILLTMKTREALAGELSDFIKNNHAYETPEIITTPILSADPAYKDWVVKETTR